MKFCSPLADAINNRYGLIYVFMKSYKGKYKVINYKKYIGDPTTVIYRSLWERKVMVYFDQRKDIKRWSSEEIVIPYRNPFDGKVHRYFPDFYCERIDPETGKLKRIL